jgi:hypothetical protein
MQIRKRLPVLATAAALLAGASVAARAQLQYDAATIAIGEKDVGRAVSGPHGREAGVWVIAETTELPTRFRRIVVTDGQGRYLVPDLPQADYSVWVRGYGLVDSPKMRAKPGQRLDLAAASAPSEADAAHYYPAIYWYSLLTIPDETEFGGENGMPANVTQQDWLTIVKNRACVGCHQLGQESRRTIPAAFSDQKTSADAWMRRVQSGQSAPFMVNPLAGQLGGAPFKYFADWTDRIAAGELPHAQPPWPQGLERNLVITEWDWGRPDKYLHDLISSDKCNPTVNANGKLYASPEYSTDELPILEPGDEHSYLLYATGARPSHAAVARRRARRHRKAGDVVGLLGRPADLGHARQQPQHDDRPEGPDVADRLGAWPRQSRLLQRGLRPSFGQALSAEAEPPAAGDARPEDDEVPFRRQLLRHAPSSVRFRQGRHVVDEGRRPSRRLAQHQGVRRDRRRREGAGLDRAGARHLTATASGTPPSSRTNRSIRRRTSASPAASTRSCRAPWTVRCGAPSACSPERVQSCDSTPARIRLRRRSPRSTTSHRRALDRVAPTSTAKASYGLSLGSGHLGSFDWRKCKGPLNGPKATGDQCPEGWTLYQYPGPGFAGIGDNSAEASYYTWVDQHNTLGLENDDFDRQRERRAVGASEREMGGPARPLPAELLCQGHGRPHRRPQCGMERARGVDDER